MYKPVGNKMSWRSYRIGHLIDDEMTASAVVVDDIIYDQRPLHIA
jgi:hypothetical protein